MGQSIIGTLSILAALGVSPGGTQTGSPHFEQQRIMKNVEGEPFLLKELGAAVASDAGDLKVVTVMPPEQRPQAYRDVDLQQDDMIMMANGRRVATINDLTSIYDALKVGSLFKLGVKRGQEMHLVSLAKGDPKNMPQLRMKIIHGGGGGDGENTETFPAVGVVLRVKDKAIVIDEVLSGESVVRGLDVKRGDVITSINGKSVTTLKAYEDLFDNLEPGKEVTWSLTRGDSRHSVTFPKPQPRMIIRREGPRK